MQNQLRFFGSTFAAFVAVTLMVNVAQAQPGRGGGRGGSGGVWKYLAEKHDKNKDGKIAKDEYKRGEATFARLDRTEDGVLTAGDLAGRSGPFGSGEGNGRETDFAV